MTLSRRTLLKATAAASAIGTFQIGRANAQSAEFTYKYANNLPVAHPLNVRANAAVAKSTASCPRPSSMSETVVCSRLSASCAWARNESVRPRTMSSSPVTACSSVWSRRVTTAPTSRPAQLAGAELTRRTWSPAASRSALAT